MCCRARPSAVAMVEPEIVTEWCTCTIARKPPAGWTYDQETGLYVCTECRKPSEALLRVLAGSS